MRLLIVRHGDPDYDRDSLTEKGWREAEYLSQKLKDIRVKEFYVSPLGRARDTASCTLEKLGRQGVECEWLQEFTPRIFRPDKPKQRSICWDWLPQDWMEEESYFHYDTWHQSPALREGGVKEEYDRVIRAFDQLLAAHGYVREGKRYRAERANRDTLVFFCHFALGSVLLSHLLNVSPMILWHNTCAAPTSVTTVVTEERRQGIANFRMLSFGDTSHLYAKGEEPAFAARFCETYDSPGERRD
ncbi:MAG TPA: histidine phosphatase family protein [Candidatus Egerieimonas intestinavium]|uniref:Histidine phosphatase family protein n=1 Tax=Candidatus Egerieimonas intestinavium TaxID=2840777 RepID=A0A9D1EJQ6_9FIRM|nr:histidine phosphatase family protein [Candidatus Egerieimonas intestinavium]